MEDTGKRPGGLTALAVINFILGGLSVIGIIVSASGLQMRNIEMREQMLDERIENDPNLIVREPKVAEQKEQLELEKKIYNNPSGKIINIVSIVPSALLIVSGIGYLKQKKILGRMMGSLYAVTSIILGIVNLLIIYEIINKTFGLMGLIGFIYPALTLFLLNVTFKDDLVE